MSAHWSQHAAQSKDKSTESSCKEPQPESQTYVGLLVPTHIIFCGTHCTRWTTIYNL